MKNGAFLLQLDLNINVLHLEGGEEVGLQIYVLLSLKCVCCCYKYFDNLKFYFI